MNTFPKANSFDANLVRSKIMGPNPLKLCEELLHGADLAQGLRVCDLGSGSGITSVMLSREYGLDVYAVDLWSDPAENRAFFRRMGVPDGQIHPVKADVAEGLPFEQQFFDAVVSIDSYNYFGRDPRYLGEKLLPYVKPGGRIYLSIPGMVRDCHDELPACLLASWTPEQLEYMHDMTWWQAMIGKTPGVVIEDMHQMTCTREAWADWIACENEYARGDRAAVKAGALDYLNTIAVTLVKR
ncbi:MAG: methyltransferase domain-containing protein [Coriobacteriia bacterium]|nr:methyltransferase domain-containing protein [Coriobacteriia bacterium]